MNVSFWLDDEELQPYNVRIFKVPSKIFKISHKIEKCLIFDSLEWFCAYGPKEKITAKSFIQKVMSGLFVL